MAMQYQPKKFMGFAFGLVSLIVMAPVAAIAGGVASAFGESFDSVFDGIVDASADGAAELGDKYGGKAVRWVARGAALHIGADIPDVFHKDT